MTSYSIDELPLLLREVEKKLPKLKDRDTCVDPVLGIFLTEIFPQCEIAAADFEGLTQIAHPGQPQSTEGLTLYFLKEGQRIISSCGFRNENEVLNDSHLECIQIFNNEGISFVKMKIHWITPDLNGFDTNSNNSKIIHAALMGVIAERNRASLEKTTASSSIQTNPKNRL